MLFIDVEPSLDTQKQHILQYKMQQNLFKATSLSPVTARVKTDTNLGGMITTTAI